jgi:hypothetical protein
MPPGPPLDGQDNDTTETEPGTARFLPGNDADAPTLTKCFLSAFATAVVTTKMINTQQDCSPETPLLVVLAASLGEAAGAPATPPIYLGDRPRGKPAQPESGR